MDASKMLEMHDEPPRHSSENMALLCRLALCCRTGIQAHTEGVHTDQAVELESTRKCCLSTHVLLGSAATAGTLQLFSHIANDAGLRTGRTHCLCELLSRGMSQIDMHFQDQLFFSC
eukprot:6474253-Amphidinium_carterae.1